MELIGRDGAALPLRVQLVWQVIEPYTVRVLFHTGPAAEVVWVLSRELLAEGLQVEAGWGDVRIRPDLHEPDALLLELRSPTGRARLRCDTWVLEQFLHDTYNHIPLSHELAAAAIDDELTALLNAAGEHENDT